MKIKIKYFNKDTKRIEKISKGSWIDLASDEEVVLKKEEFRLIKLGIGMILPACYEAILAPRSSTFKKWGIIQTNSIGVIDGFALDNDGNIIEGTGYCGDNDEWMMPVYATKDTVIHRGDRICQFRLQKKQEEIEFEEVNHLLSKDRGGFGSTGN